MVMSPNSIEVPATIWGCHYAGGVVAPVNPELLPTDLHQQLMSSGAKALVVHPRCLDTALQAFELGGLTNVRLLALAENSEGVQTTTEFMECVQSAEEGVGRTPINASDDLAYLVYSSGTTGKPKAVMITHRNVVAAVLLQARLESPHASWQHDKTLAVLPVYHIYGENSLWHLKQAASKLINGK
jgi:acyl-CoA synthetase (AMP-forming)/AMP-acid ligase II